MIGRSGGGGIMNKLTLTDNNIIDEWAGGEGSVDCNFVNNDGIDKIGSHFVHFDENFGAAFGAGAGDDFLGDALVEYIDKGSRFDLHYSTDR